MDQKDTCLIGEPNALGIFKTLYLFLQNHNFPKSAETLREEWGLKGSEKDIENVSNLSLLLTRCKCSRKQANQTNSPKNSYPHYWIEGAFQGETFQDDTHVFFICNHCQHKKDQKETDGQNIEKSLKEPLYNHKNLKCKFTQLQDDHQKLIAVTSELTTALQMNIIGQTKNIHSVLEHCKNIYPTLFETTTQISSLDSNESGENDLENNITNEETNKATDNVKISIERASQFPDLKDLVDLGIPQEAENLHLERSPRSPLTPDTVRLVLESVFQRIFELDRSISPDRIQGNSPLNKDDIEKIVTDVLSNNAKSCPSPNCGAGEGDLSRGESASIFRQYDVNFFIDYTKLKNDLIHSENEKKIRILQALRWRITKNEASVRDKTLDSYIVNDVLDLHASVSIPERFLLAYGSDHYVQEATCRLINTLASLTQGRDYLTVDDRLLKRVLVRKVKDVRTVSGAVIRNMLIASVQKLSIRKQCRIQMVKEGLFEVMIDYLDEFYEKLSKYCLEYCSALLMNLCLVDQAKERATKIPKKVVGLLRKFLEGDNEFCLPYINGIMFSLFEKPVIILEATNQNLDKTIMKLIQNTETESVKKQLDFIVQSRLFGKSDPNIHEDDEDGKDEVDLLEVELDQDDFITQLPSGEKLLLEYKTENHNAEKSCQSITFSTIKKEPPNSAKSFSEESKQFVHKPSLERGIFEAAKPRRYTTCSQNLLRNFNKNRTPSQSRGRISATPLCYMENCQKLQYDKNVQCSCSKCSPGQSRYSCGCYEAIRKDIADSANETDDFMNSDYKIIEPSKNSQLKSADNIQTPSSVEYLDDDSVGKSQKSTSANDFSLAINDNNNNNNNDGSKRSGCQVCGEKKCECAFESRPKLIRTPTL